MLPTLRRCAARAAGARVRFAPSPTGFLHVGGLRTALFNYLLARSTGGAFVLRIEDTDQARLVPGAADALQRALQWAGIVCDEGPTQGGPYGPYVQSERLAIYRTYADRLLQTGRAYRDFRAQTERNVGARTSALLREAYLPPNETEAQERIARGERFVVRLRMDPTRTFSFTDGVYGTLHFRPDAINGVGDDPILIKSDGWPTYHLASVVDDTEMAITHVLRGEEWLPSMPKHLALYEALGVAPPAFVHLPLLINPDGSKLSKRSGDVRVEDFHARGIEPEALVNLVALTGYNHQNSTADESDILRMPQLIAQFALPRISHSRATLPTDKLPYLNRRHLVAKATDIQARTALLPRIRPLFDAVLGTSAHISDDALLNATALGCQRVDTLEDVPASVAYLFATPDWGTDACRNFRSTVPTPAFGTYPTHTDAVVHEAQSFFGGIEVWDQAALHAALQAWMKAQPHGRAAVQKSLRIALTAQKAGAPVADIAHLLGQAPTLARLRAAAAWDAAHR